MTAADTMKFMREICPHRLGNRVKVAPTNQYAADWPDTYVVVMVAWDYQKGAGHSVNIAIASDDDIRNRWGWTDGWTPDDLLPAT